MSKVVSLNDVLNELEAKSEKITTTTKKVKISFDETPYEVSNKFTSKNKKTENNYKLKTSKKKKSSKLGFTKRSNYDRCKNSAIYSLAMREHSRLEITNKLKKKDYIEGVNLDKLLDELEDSNYLNEERFVESFIRYRSGRGQGFIKISNELRLRGIEGSLIQSAMEEAEIDWFQLAKQQREKKFGLNKPEDFKEKARQMRFLSGRGFDSEVIRATVN